MEPMQDLVTYHDGADGFTFTASAYHGVIRLRASGRRTMAANYHEHQLQIHLILDYHDRGGGEHARRVLRGNKSGSIAEFLDMHPARRATAVACIVSRGAVPSGVLERFCVHTGGRSSATT